jgi:epoxyqueuosine reductase
VFSRDDLLELARDAGFHRYRILNTKDAGYPFPPGSLLLCALSCYREENDDNSRPGNPHGLIAPFARRNYYGECVIRLKRIFKEIRRRTGLAKREGRIFSNSRLPEKQMAARAGLGFYGRNSLIIAPGADSLPNLGSFFVVAGIFLPFQWHSDCSLPGDPSPGGHCGSCSACVEACPVGALSEKGELDTEICLQSLSTSRKVFSQSLKEIWGARIYGCQICQDVCPFNRDLTVTSLTTQGELGPSIALRDLLKPPAENLRSSFKGTALGQSWIPMEALQRNALIAAGNRQDPAILQYLRPYLRSSVPFIRDAANWSYERIVHQSNS